MSTSRKRSNFPLVSLVAEDVKNSLGYMHEQLTKAEIASLVKLVMSYYDKGFNTGYFTQRKEIMDILDTKPREDSFFVKGEIKKALR